MNEYQDYYNYKKEHKELLHKLEAVNSSINLCLDDVIRVLDYIYEKHEDGAKIDDDLAEIFDVGYGYFAGIMQDISIYYKDYFNCNIDVLNGYSNLIVAQIMLDDIKSFLDVEDYLTEERQETFDKVQSEIDSILVNKKPVTSEYMEALQETIESLLPLNLSYKPVYDVFAMIAEELNVY